MKVCLKYRQPIALLAVDAVDVHEAQSLRAHLETCEGCRGYLSEVRGVTKKLAKTEIASDIQTSNAFHQRMLGAIDPQRSAWDRVLDQLQTLLNWRVALPVTAAALVIVGLSVMERSREIPLAPQPVVQPVARANVQTDLEPTISNYQMIANHSLEKLDELLTRQAIKNPPATPIYTASTLTQASALD
jgi:hypothetical protein